ncbi:MAG: alpha/beta hydrolase [Firmicutes bacterium]|nr:alpha/beta hydrolase [Bacillota bacterium]
MTEKSKRINRAAKIGAAGAAGITAVLLAAKWAYGYAFKVDREKTCNPYQLIGKHSENYKDDIFQSIEKLEKLPCEWVCTRSQEGYKLAGRYYHQQDGAPLMIFFHGYRSPALRDFCGGFWIYREQGYNILVVDQRAHSRSEGKALTMGIKERYDCVKWVEYAVDRFGSDIRILLGGISMGAATVMMVAELLQDCPNVKGILADCGYSTVEGVMKQTIRQMKLPEEPSWRLLKLGAKIYGGFDLSESSAVESLRNSRFPIVFIHGQADERVPAEMTEENAAAAAAERIVTFMVPEAEHGMSFYIDRKGYYDTVLPFIKELLEDGMQK